MATLLIFILATLESGTTNASPLPTASSTPTLTQTCLLPAYTGNDSPLQLPVPTATGLLHPHNGNVSRYPAFNASQYPRHNFTGHHRNHTHDHWEHGNRTVDGILRMLDGERHHDKNGTHHRHNGIHCYDGKPHHPSASGHAKLPYPDGDHQRKKDTRRLHEEGYPFAELIGRDIDDGAVPRYMEELENHAVSPSSSSSEAKAEKAKLDIDDEHKHVPASAKYMEFTDEDDEGLLASVKYTEYDDKRATSLSSLDVRIETSKRGEEDDDGLTSWELLGKSDLSLFGKRGCSNCVLVAGGILCKKDSTQQSGESLDDEEVHSHNEKRTMLDCANIAGRIEYKPLVKRVSGSELWLGDENAVPAHINGLD